MGSSLNYNKKNDFYEVLGVKTDTDAKQIKLAYYKMAQKYHPDKAGDSQKALDKFKSVSAAYEVLVDEVQRKTYDRLRTEAKQSNSAKSGYNSHRSQGQ